MAETQTILIVDDEPFSLKRLQQAFHGHYRVLFATNGEDALRIAAREQPDLIILDVMMPGMNGYEVLRHLKEDERFKLTPVVFLTGKDQQADEKTGLEMGAADYWAKPVNFDIARIRARNHLELKRHRDTLAQLALTDGLSGIPNRRGFDETLEREWLRSVRAGCAMSLLLIDIDHFKSFNDNYGHPAGDACLRRVATLIDETLNRPGDYVARYGGEEFACILPETDQAGAFILAESLRAAVASERIDHHFAPTVDYLTISVGLATVMPDRQREMADLVELADKALYAAKRNGRNVVVAAPEILS
ncbi:MAG TPA: diguanylate cyclase [Aliidongia sp.]|uniref:GGDEF domain-containing response regulator n=1 Tax=Aliidongia sp. TaxID=1914230 RepID=UPI002DDCF1FE|nr:diguanylate cyclase [Aliidongia sp.]HEV2676759.1 diguanylate cyclase [Aliidongia sp.]